ncbi:hypothetical protein [Bacillus sp. T3]|uniref:hypothetical protein n=1 Tax=Bacillus sp. T3 TaxID=467262 RepID=UPI002981EE81|nr:hypothetical protein [Bacillus sp. T3]
MDFYHWWIYRNILNAQWFVWSVVIFIFIFNFLGPVLMWLTINSKPLPFFTKKQKDEEKMKHTSSEK